MLAESPLIRRDGEKSMTRQAFLIPPLPYIDTVADIIASQEARIDNIGFLFENTCLVFKDFHESLLDTKQEREGLRTGLRDILTQNEHLRRKDFDRMMRAILSVQEGREKEVRDLLDTYFDEQKEMAAELRRTLAGVKESLAQGETQRIREFQELLKDILSEQDARKAGVTAKLKEFQEEQKALAARLKTLLTKGRELRIKDLKSMLNEFEHKRLKTAGCWNWRVRLGHRCDGSVIPYRGSDAQESREALDQTKSATGR